MTRPPARLLSLATLAGTLAVLCFPLIFRGEVIFPHENRLEVGLAPCADPEVRINRVLSDHPMAFVPELNEQLRGDRSGWIATWTPHVELGRPTAHVSGFSRAFVVTRLLALGSSDPLRVYTWLALLAIGLTAVFGWLLFAELGLRPAAGLTGALGLSAGLFMTARTTFVMFLWGVCWTVALLWLSAGFLRRPRLAFGLGVAFCVHAMFLTAYPQQIVWHGYLLGGFALLCAVHGTAPPRRRLWALALLAACAIVGLVSVAPVYLDLALNARRSARLEVPDEFFTRKLLTLQGWRDAALFWAQSFDTLWVRNPVDGLREPLRFGGSFGAMSFTPLFALLAVCSASRALLRRLWPLHVFVAACLVLTFWREGFLFGLHHAGLGLSRFRPLQALHVPVVVAAAYAADAALRGHLRSRWAATALVLFLVGAALYGFRTAGLELQPADTAIGLALAAATLAFLLRPRPLLLGLCAVGTVLAYGMRVQLTRAPGDIRLDSPLVQEVREATRDGSRFAWLDAGREAPPILPPNEELLLDVRSIHTYDSLSSRDYQRFVLRLSKQGTLVYGRRYLTLASGPGLDPGELSLAGVGLLLCPERLSPKLVREQRTEGTVHLGRTRRPPLLEAQVLEFEVPAPGSARCNPAPSAAAVERTLSRDDDLRFAVTPEPRASLLFVSQQYHPQWRAWADGIAADAVEVNDFYQGVLLPPGTREVELAFRPWVRWSWIPQVAFALAALVCVARRLRRPAPAP